MILRAAIIFLALSQLAFSDIVKKEKVAYVVWVEVEGNDETREALKLGLIEKLSRSIDEKTSEYSIKSVSCTTWDRVLRLMNLLNPNTEPKNVIVLE